MKDFRGVPIVVGSTVVWPAQSGHYLSMCLGYVVKINPNSITVRSVDRESLVSIKRIDNVVVLA